MKNKFAPPYVYSAIKILIILLLSINSFAQSDKDLKEALAKLDTSAFKGKAFFEQSLIHKISYRTPSKEREKPKRNSHPHAYASALSYAHEYY